MKIVLVAVAIGVVVLVLGFSTMQDSPADETLSKSDTSVMVLMLGRITAASNTLWSVEDPQSDSDWQVFDDAALQLIQDFEQIRLGGTGPNDVAWANDPAWQAFVDQEIVALEAAREAIGARDLDKLWAANDALYTPCETCHIDFNPAVSSDGL